MRFIYPDFLWALTLLAIPVIVHLFNFRRFRKIPFTNVRFLQDIQQTTSSTRKLKHLLVLLSRLLAMAFLVIAFAQPYFPRKERHISTGASALSVYIDNSFSMAAVGREGELLENAKNKAREIANSYKSGDRFMLITNDFEGRHQRLLAREDFIKLVDEVQYSPVSRKLSEVYLRQRQTLNSSGFVEKNCYLISDFQEGMADADKISADTGISVYPVILEASKRDNISLDSCWLESPYIRLKQAANLKVRIKSFSEEAIENGTVNLRINNIQKAIGTFSLNPGSTSEITLSFTPEQDGWQKAELSISDYPVTFDDKLHFSLFVQSALPVLCINNSEADKNISSVYEGDPYFRLNQVALGQIDYSTFGNYRLIILNAVAQLSSGLEQELKRYVNEGGSLLLFPSEKPENAAKLGPLLSGTANLSFGNLNSMPDDVQSFNKESEVFANMFEKLPSSLDLPKVSKHYSIVRKGYANEEVLMRLASKDVFLARYMSGKGRLYLCSSAPGKDFSNFQDHWSFVPFLLKIALLSSSQEELYETIGKEKPVKVRIPGTGKDMAYKLKADKFEAIPEVIVQDGSPYFLINGQVSKEGIYTLSGQTVEKQLIAFNYDRTESPSKFLSAEELEERGKTAGLTVLNPANKSLAQIIGSQNLESRLWKLCILIALLFFLIEVLLLRFLK